jgi:DNA sulfur modification protein DndE
MTRALLLFLIAIQTVTVALFAQQLPRIESPSIKTDTFNIIRYGANPASETVNTTGIQLAIDACSAQGGGVVLIPAGFWVTGPLQLKSNVNLHVAKNAVVQFSTNTNDFPLIKTNWEGLDAIRAQSPIYGVDLENIAITGTGILDGSGQVWRPVKKNKLTSGEWKELIASGGFLNEGKDTWYPSESSLKGSAVKRPGVVAEGFDVKNSEEIKDFLRPNMVSLVRCKKVLLEGVTFQNSPAWCIHPLMIQHLTVRNVTVRNPWNAQNGDGIDVESCRYVLIEDSKFDVGDDGICIKSGRDEEGRKRGIPTEDVIVRNCTVFHGHGGFVVGSEMSGGARNIWVSNCNFLGTDIGLRFKTTRGRGGVVENVFIDNIRMNNIGGAAILFDMYYMAKDPLAVFAGESNPSIAFEPVNEGTPAIRNIKIKNVYCKGAETGIFVRGLPEMNISSINIEDVFIESKKGFVCIEGSDITLKNAKLVVQEKAAVQAQDSKRVTIDNLILNQADATISVSGERSESIKIMNSKGLTQKQISLGDKVSKNVVVIK